MDQTIEKMADEKANMMGNQFFGEVSHEEPKECAVMGLIKNQIIVLEEELDVAYKSLGRVSTDDENWSAMYERKMTCKILKSQIAILNKLQRDFENMLTPMPKSMAMAG